MEKAFIIFVLLLTSYGCASQKQGISGKVVWLSGNHMPGPGTRDRSGEGIQREIHIYEPVKSNEASQSNGFYTKIPARFVAKVLSNPDGSFTVNLPPGEYSVFTKEEKGLFANILDGQGRINVLEVKPGAFTEVTFQVNYEAAY